MQQIKITPTITKRSDCLDIYLSQISHLPLLTSEEEVELAARIREGDDEALHTLVNANLRFVVSVAKQYQSSGQPLVDIIEDGNLGLIKAAHDFDETRGFKFISYAVWWIRQAILQGMADNSRMVRLPMNQISLLGKINKAVSRFEQQHGRYPDEEELSAMIDFPAGKIRDTLSVGGTHVSLDEPFEEGDGGSMLDVLPDASAEASDKEMDRESLASDMDRVLSILPPRERDILKSFFGIGCNEMSLEEIADAFGLTRERVRQLKEKSLRKLNCRSVVSLLRQHIA